MLRGTRVGQAYVALTADGSGINKDITDAFDDVDYDEFGDRFGQKFADRLRDHLRAVDRDTSDVLDRMGRAIESDNRLTDGIRHQLANAFDMGSLDGVVTEVGKRAGVEFGNGFDVEVNKAVLDSLERSLMRAGKSSNLDMSDLVRSIDSGNGGISLPGRFLDDAVKQVQAVVQKSRKEYEGLWGDLLREQEKVETERTKIAENAVRERIKQEARGDRIVYSMQQAASKNWERLLAERDRATAASIAERVKQEAMGDRIVLAMQKAMAKNAADEEKMLRVAHRLNQKFDADREAAVQRLGKMQEQAQAIEYRRQKANLDDMLKKINARVAATQKLGRLQEAAARMNAKFDNDHMKMLDQAYKLNTKYDNDHIRLIEMAHRLNTKFDADRMTSLQRLGKMQESALRMNEKFNSGSLDGRGMSVSGNRDDKSFASQIGKMFGAGSRNNFLNTVGKSIGGIVGLVEKAGTFAGTFASNMEKAGESASLVSRVMAGFGGSGGGGVGMFAKLGATLPLLAVSIGVVVVALSAAVSIASALLGVVVALASTITSALVGALAIGVGAFAAIGVAAGLATMAFTAMTNSQRKYFFDTFEPIHAMFAGLGQIMLRQMIPAFQTWSRNLQVALSLVKPLADVMGGAFARVGNIITASLSGPGIRMFIAAMTDTLPRIVTNFASAFGGFLNGVSGIFAALMPYVLRFSGYLSRVAGDFARWATSAKGQNSIVSFVDRALNSLASLWNFVKAVGGLLSTLLFNPKGQRVGNNIFDDMAKGVRRFTDYISKEHRLEDWFKQARKMAKILGDVIEGIGKALAWLDQPWVVNGLKDFVDAMKSIFKFAGKVADAIGWVEDRLDDLLPGTSHAADEFERAARGAAATRDALAGWKIPDGAIAGAEALNSLLLSPMTTHPGFIGPVGPDTPPVAPYTNGGTIDDLINSGTDALNSTFEQYGGHMPDPTKGDKGPKYSQFEGSLAETEWANPYAAFVASIIKQSGTLADEIRKTAREARKDLADAMTEALKGFATLIKDVNAGAVGLLNSAITSTDAGGIADSINQWIDDLTASTNSAIEASNTNAAALLSNAKATRDQMIATAQAARDAAAQDLASATNPKDAKAALERLKVADRALAVAKQKGRELFEEAERAADDLIANSIASTDRIERAKAIMAGQAVYSYDNALNLARGLVVESATLADYAEARRWAGERLAEANQKLVDAIALRDNYGAQIAESVRSFGSLMTASAKSLDGVEQALTVGDITDNLRERLEKVKKFQESMRQLLAMGLSNSAYKQIMDSGVEAGSVYADALLQGGQGGISEVNDLINQMDTVAGGLGDAAASQLYQAGVDAAQGLVDGLLSLSEQLDSAAARLGKAIGDAVKRELGIASPSRVLRNMMGYVGDGAVLGLDDQHLKVGAAAARFADQISVSPEVAVYAARRGTSPTTEDGVSGNDTSGTPKFLWTGDIVTPTEDPEAVTTEVLNELTGRLT